MNNKNFKYWPYLLAAGIILIFTAVAPYLLSKLAWGIEFGQETGSIGDTIGGITAPFLSLLGSILVFAALKAQIDANKAVQKQFDKQDNDLKLESINKIELLTVDLDSIIKDIELRAERMKEYYEKEREKPFELNVLRRTSSRVYSRILEFERLSIYKGFKEFKSERDEWIIHYNKLYRIFDYLPDFFDSVYLLHDRHVKDIFEQKMAIRKRLLDLMEISTKYTEGFKSRYPMLLASSSPLCIIVDNLMFEYHSLIDECFDSSGQMLKETDFDKITSQVLLGFISKVMEIRRNKTHYDPLIHPLIEVASEVRKDIELIRQRANEFSKNIEEQYKKLMIDNDGENSTLTSMKKLKEFVDEELSKLT